MAFFDLNIPYEPNPATTANPAMKESPEKKGNRTRIAVRCMELGYAGVAYNRTINGVMSDLDRCSIPPLPPSSISSLLSLSPSFAVSFALHRELLGYPRSAPFRQYSRLTFLVDNLAQGTAFNSGNHVLKTYDLLAVHPLSQIAFDHACQNWEVDIIAIDFGKSLPFRMKLSMIKAALKRGVYFEIVYSGLVGDVQVRRQIISNAKLLVDWTRGKNIIFSSAASSEYELRGPYDIANLSSLLGLSMERAKEAVSKNCRVLIQKALRRKNFYKEAVRVELLSSDRRLNLKEPLSADWLKWDPLSSGEGDLQLDDVLKSFSDAAKASKMVKAIDFTSIIDGLPPGGLSLMAKGSGFLVAHAEAHQNSVPDSVNNQISVGGSSVEPQCLGETCVPAKEIGTHALILEENLRTSADKHILSEVMVADSDGQHLSKSAFCSDKNINVQNDEKVHQICVPRDESCATCPTGIEPIISPEKFQVGAPVAEKSINCLESSADVIMISPPERLDASDSFAENTLPNTHGSGAIIGSEKYDRNEDMMEIDRKDQASKSVRENVLGVDQLSRSLDDTIEVVDQIPTVEAVSLEVINVADSETQGDVPIREGKLKVVDADASLTFDDEFKVEDISSVIDGFPIADGTVNKCKHEAATCGSSSSALSVSPAGQTKAKSKAPHRSVLLPLKRLLNPVSFKKARKLKRPMKLKQ